MGKKNYENYRYVSKDVIRNFLNGDEKALDVVMKRYSSYTYGKFSFLAPAYKLDPDDLDIEDLNNEAWARCHAVVMDDFKFKRKNKVT